MGNTLFSFGVVELSILWLRADYVGGGGMNQNEGLGWNISAWSDPAIRAALSPLRFLTLGMLSFYKHFPTEYPTTAQYLVYSHWVSDLISRFFTGFYKIRLQHLNTVTGSRIVAAFVTCFPWFVIFTWLPYFPSFSNPLITRGKGSTNVAIGTQNMKIMKNIIFEHKKLSISRRLVYFWQNMIILFCMTFFCKKCRV